MADPDTLRWLALTGVCLNVAGLLVLFYYLGRLRALNRRLREMLVETDTLIETLKRPLTKEFD